MPKKWKSVRIDEEVLKLVEKNKEQTGVPVSVFVEKAILEKIENDKKKKTT